MKSISIRLASAVLALNVCILGPLGHSITINVEYTDEGDPIPHDENPSWDPSGLILKKTLRRGESHLGSASSGTGHV